MPMTGKAIARCMAAKARDTDRSKPLFVELGRSFNDGRGQSVEVGVGTTRRKPAGFIALPKEPIHLKLSWLLMPSTVR